MKEYSKEFKLEVIKYYKENTYGWKLVARHFKIPAWTTVRRWVKKYEEHGEKGLGKEKNAIYDGDFKINVIKYMRENHLSASAIAVKFNLGSEGLVTRWEHQYYKEGPQAFYKKRCEKPKEMKKSNKDKESKENEELLKEIEYLRMENEYLKKLNALVQERIKRENKKK